MLGEGHSVVNNEASEYDERIRPDKPATGEHQISVNFSQSL